MKVQLGFINKEDCVGCTACMSICPLKCISMESDSEGFKYPIKNSEACIECGLCEKVCPIKTENHKEEQFNKKAYAAITKNEKVLMASSSGGMFSEICEVLKSDITYIYGAFFDGLYVKHGYAEPNGDITKFCKSKYVQSDMLDNFVCIREQLEQGYRVVFSGTPCQVAGLKNYLNKEYENLFCVDFICHGVGSPKVFQYCMEKLGLSDKKVVAYEFRHKKNSKYNERYNCIRTYGDGSQIDETYDIYMRLFLKQFCLRPSCSTNCKFRLRKRMSDITMADFNGLCEVFDDLKDDRNYSTLIINSKKGQEVFELMQQNIEWHECSLDDIKKYNPLYCTLGNANAERMQFFEDFIAGKDVVEMYANKYKFSWKQNIIRKVPWKVKYFIKKIIRKIQKNGSK